jgi:hypothetical protein
MSKAEDEYRLYLDYKSAVTKGPCRCVSLNKSGDAQGAIMDLGGALDNLEKQTRKVFDHDQARLRERNATISYLQDRLAEKE